MAHEKIGPFHGVSTILGSACSNIDRCDLSSLEELEIVKCELEALIDTFSFSQAVHRQDVVGIGRIDCHTVLHRVFTCAGRTIHRDKLA